MIAGMPAVLAGLAVFGGPVEAPVPNPPNVAEFQRRDADGDGMLTRLEYMRPDRGTKREKSAKRKFGRFDFDGNGMLSPIEFAQISPGKARPTTFFDLLDADANGVLTRTEYARRHAPGLEDATLWEFRHYDADGTGRIERGEFLSRGTGPAGKVVRSFFRFVRRFSRLDLDNDGLLTSDEFVRPHIGGKWEEDARRRTVSCDFDGNGSLSLLEFAQTPASKADLATIFGLLDANSDDVLTRQEYAKPYSSEYAEAVKLEFSHYDADADGKIERGESLDRSGSQAGMFVSRFSRRDADRDGRLSREEYVKPSLGRKWEKAARKESVRFDLDDDGFLSVREFALSPRAKASRTMRFALGDANQDDALDREELASVRPHMRKTTIGARFLRLDKDSDNQVSIAEWNREGWKQSPIFDPVVDLLEKETAAFRDVIETFDENGDQGLDADEWPSEALDSRFPHLVDLDRAAWDRDGDGAVTRDEARRLLEVAWGVRRPRGELYRDPTGHLFRWAFIEKLDEDGDGDVSREELVTGHWGERERNIKLFKMVDADGDGTATFGELFAADHFEYDVLWGFSRLDANLDGLIDQGELDATGRKWQRRYARDLIGAFDDDGDDRLNLREFRLTPLGNYYTNWRPPRRDADYDGRLSWGEFYTEQSPTVIALYREYFRRFDRDDDGSLAPDEFEFRIDLEKVSDEIAFAVKDRDGDGEITFEETFDKSEPKDNDPKKMKVYQRRLIRAEQSFLTGDTDGDGGIDLAEFRKSRENAAAAAMLGSAAAPPRQSEEGLSWPIIGFLALDGLVLLGVGVWFLRGSRSKAGSR